jgi:hypothetical protein
VGSIPSSGTKLERVSRHLGLPGIPADFLMWSPNWETSPSPIALAKRIEAFVKKAEPVLCIIDPLRVYFPASGPTMAAGYGGGKGSGDVPGPACRQP